MSDQARSNRVNSKAIFVLVIALAAIAISVPASIGGTTKAAGTRVDALLLGPVKSPLLRALKAKMGSQLRLVRDARLSPKIDLVIIDGDQAVPSELDGLRIGAGDQSEESADDESTLVRAARTARWVLVLESDKADRRQGLSHLTGFRPSGGGDQAYLFRRKIDEAGVPEVNILTESLAVYSGLHGRARARAVHQRTQQVVGIIRRALTEPERRARRLADASPALPLDLLKAEWNIGPQTQSMTPIVTSRGTQTPSVTLNYHYDLFLARDTPSASNPTGKYQLISASIDGSFSPKKAEERFVADRDASSWGKSFGLSRGYWTGALEPWWWTDQSEIQLAKTEPATPNDETKYTTGTTFEFGAELSGEGPSGTAKVTISNTKEYTVRDWVVRNGSAGIRGAWRFSARNPCDVRSWPPQGGAGGNCFDFGGMPIEPNDLSKSTIGFHVSAIWKTRAVSRGFANFRSAVAALLVKNWCKGDPDATWAAPLCFSGQEVIPESRLAGGSSGIDLNAVVPVGIAGLSFQPADSKAFSRPFGQSIAVVSGTTVLGKLKLASPAPWDVTIVISKTDKAHNLVLSKDSFVIKKGETEGTFRIDTNGNGLNSDQATTVPIGIFYDGFTRSQLTVCASRQAQPCQG